MASSTVRMSWSRGTCFSALSWSSAVTKSRFMVRLPSRLPFAGPNSVLSDRQKKRGGHPRSMRAAGEVDREYTPEGVDRRSGERHGHRKAALDIVVEDPLEFLDQALATQGPVEPAVNEDRRNGLLECPRQADSDIGVLALTRPVDDAAHHRHAQLLDAWMALLPDWHLVLEIGLDLLGHHLEERGGGPA